MSFRRLIEESIGEVNDERITVAKSTSRKWQEAKDAKVAEESTDDALSTPQKLPAPMRRLSMCLD